MARYRSRWNRPDSLSEDVPEEEPPPAAEEAPPCLPRRDDALLLEQLEHAEIVACEQLPQGSNYSFAVGLTTSGQDIEHIAIYKPKRGEVPLWDFPSGTLYKRERAAYLTASIIGWDFIPPTVIREGPFGIGTVQLYIESDGKSHFANWRHQHRAQLMRMAVFDYITNNADRKAGHCLLDSEQRVWGIDHGLTFNVDPKLRTVIQEFSGTAIPSWLLEDLQRFTSSTAIDSLTRDFRSLLEKQEVHLFLKRLERLMMRRIFPRLDGYASVPHEWW